MAGKVQLPPLSGPIPSIDSCLKDSTRHSRTPHVSDILTPLPSTRRTLGALNPAVNQRPTFAKTWLICPAEATDTQLGPDGADNRGPQDLILQVHGDRCPNGRPKYQIRKIASTSTFLFARSTKLGHSLPKDRDEEEGDAENGDGELSRSQLFAYDLHKRDEYFSIPHCTQRAFLAFVMTDTPRSRPIDSTYLQLDQENLRLTTGQGIISLTSDQAGCSVILGSTFKNRPRENTQRYQDAMACVVKYGKPSLFIMVTCNPEWPEIKAALGLNDQACNRPELIARAFEAKLNRLCDDDRFGNKQRAGCL
ncbi:BQ5605_C066g12822 [Microbotryum silenes-dioicae]|uniref:BQ5605_C029g10595 protein n=1 Tax=Microbotryum silenes-dioicae TaxID=796604 RepID=A0A2X0MUV7_9BASI|nr:BQ5605_C029g10595 [Microbotryum silenes-dioicae]SGZ35283.1 BQ5605_C066g12822 [Microbotryum silenes-dioicae]